MDVREVLSSQKNERDAMLANSYINRENLGSLKAALRHDLIKVIVGPRRAGKSVFAIEALKGQDFVYLNFDDERLLKVTDYDEILKGIPQVYGSTKTLFFDEIQNLQKWELFLSRLHRSGYNIVITGSNSKLLGRELSTHLTGRFHRFDIYPFSFKEFLRAKGYGSTEDFEATKAQQGQSLALLLEYLQKGGYPEVVVKGVDLGYLKTLYDSIILRDIVERYRVRAVDDLKNVGGQLITSYSSPVSMNSLKKALNMKSTTTVEKFVGYLSEAFLTFTVDRFSYKAKERAKSRKKVYVYDTGMIDAVSSEFSRNIGRKIENAVAIELARQRHDGIFYYKTADNKEVDFVVKDGIRVSELIQVCYDIDSPKAKAREVGALVKAASEIKCDKNTLITWDKQDDILDHGVNISVVSLRQWLTGWVAGQGREEKETDSWDPANPGLPSPG
jgi:hypothetical protein